MSSIAVVSRQPDVVERVQRWAAAVSASAQVAADPAQVRRAWRGCGAVVIDDLELSPLAMLTLPRRDHVVVVSADPDEAVWRQAVQLGAVGVFAPSDDDAVTGALTRALDGRGEACVVSLVGACGGIGSSTLTVACAQLAAHRGVRALALDADLAGPGLEFVAGVEDSAGLRWHDVADTDGHVAARTLTEMLPVAGGAAVLSFRRGQPRGATPAVLGAIQRGFDVVVADVPRHCVGSELGADVLARSPAAVLLVPEHVTGLAAAREVLTDLRGFSDRQLVVSCPVPGGLGPRQVEYTLGIPVLSRLPRRRRVAGQVESGQGPGRVRSLRRVAGQILDAIGIDS